MNLGWIDFSENERGKVMNVLSLLSVEGTLDELGIAAVRDGFADIFFPGTSTIQTRAKYFFIVPYIARDMERGKETQYGRMVQAFDAKEEECAKKLLKQTDLKGIIGKRALANYHWVKRAPSAVYWNGLRKYGIFRPQLVMSTYLSEVCEENKEKYSSRGLGNDVEDEESARDDMHAGEISKTRFWNIPTYEHDWFENLSMQLTIAEGDFLKKQIIKSCPDSLLKYILANNWVDFMEVMDTYVSWSSLEPFIEKHKKDLPKELVELYYLALDFANFTYAMRVIYNLQVSQGKNTVAQDEYKKLLADLDSYTKVDIELIFAKLGLCGRNDNRSRNAITKSFLLKLQKTMCELKTNEQKLEDVKEIITAREIDLKGSERSKCHNHAEINPNEWYGGSWLDYRVWNANTLISDIFVSQEEAEDAQSNH